MGLKERAFLELDYLFEKMVHFNSMEQRIEATMYQYQREMFKRIVGKTCLGTEPVGFIRAPKDALTMVACSAKCYHAFLWRRYKRIEKRGQDA